MNKKITTILFDFDGVITDTQSQYDKFSEELKNRYNMPEDFVSHSRGTTMEFILNRYFSNYPKEEQNKILEESIDFELALKYPWVDGILDFLKYLKENNYKIGLVTSSSKVKMDVAYKSLNLKKFFDVLVTGDDITDGKPDPMCYLKAASMLQSVPDECLVFEDAIHGVSAGKKAGMKVIALTTSFPSDELKKENPDIIIKDFTEMDPIKQFLN